MIGLLIRDGSNVQRTISQLFVRDGGNVSREISELWVRDENNVPRLVFNPTGSLTLTVEASPTTVGKIALGTSTATSNATTATPSGGTGPYTYLWILLSHDADVPPAATQPTSAVTAFIQTSMVPDGTYTSQWRVTVTDANSFTATAEVTANFACLTI